MMNYQKLFNKLDEFVGWDITKTPIGSIVNLKYRVTLWKVYHVTGIQDLPVFKQGWGETVEDALNEAIELHREQEKELRAKDAE
mgnify:CR=1 FL=1